MKILIACEFSGTVRETFKRLGGGYDIWSCDTEPTDIPGQHYQGDVMNIINDGWDMMIAFPPCTHLAVSGARHFEQKRKDGRQQQGIDFFMQMINAPIPKIAVENPIGIMSSIYRKPNQIVQPYHFGHEASKATCLWLKNLPLLKHNNVVGKGEVFTSSTGKKYPAWSHDAIDANGKKIGYNTPEIKKIRNKTFQGIADAMADQWGKNELS